MDPKDLFIAPVSAVQSVLAKAGLSARDIDLVELNEAFAAQCLACVSRMELDPSKVNVRGGAIALGHPIVREWCPGACHVSPCAGRRRISADSLRSASAVVTR